MGEKKQLISPSELAFFGLTSSEAAQYRLNLFSQIHEIVFHGKGGYDWNTIYNMPIWLRKFTFNKIKEFYEQEAESYKKSQKDKKPLHTSPIVCRNISIHGFCKYAETTCLFAHNLQELLPRDCSHGSRCRYSNNCHFLHPHETVQMYVQRRNIQFNNQ